MSHLLHIVFSQAKFCAFDEILFRLRKLIGDDRGDEYRLAFVCDFWPSPKISKENFRNGNN